MEGCFDEQFVKNEWLDSYQARVITSDDYEGADETLLDDLLPIPWEKVQDDSRSSFFCHITFAFIVVWVKHLFRMIGNADNISLLFDDYIEMTLNGSFDDELIFLRTMIVGFDGTVVKGLGKDKPFCVLKVRPAGLRPPLSQLSDCF